MKYKITAKKIETQQLGFKFSDIELYCEVPDKGILLTIKPTKPTAGRFDKVEESVFQVCSDLLKTSDMNQKLEDFLNENNGSLSNKDLSTSIVSLLGQGDFLSKGREVLNIFYEAITRDSCFTAYDSKLKKEYPAATQETPTVNDEEYIDKSVVIIPAKQKVKKQKNTKVKKVQAIQGEIVSSNKRPAGFGGEVDVLGMFGIGPMYKE